MKRSIKQSTLSRILNIASIGLIVLSIISFFLIVQSYNNVDKAYSDRFALIENARLFIDGSDYLTQEVRAYAVSGNTVHRDNYLKEYEETQRREEAVQNLRAVGLTFEDDALISDMYTISNALVPMEKKAIELASAGDTEGALALVYGDSYHDSILEIRELETTFIKNLNDRTQTTLAEQKEKTRGWTIVTVLCLGITAILQLVTTIAIKQRIIDPLLLARDQMLELEKGNLRGNADIETDDSEIGMLLGSIQSTKKELDRYVGDITRKLELIAAGHFDERIESEYIGDFAAIKTAINQIAETLSIQFERDKKSRLELKEAYHEANAANQAKSDFLSNMSHEIRTPLNAIIGMTNIGLESGESERMLYSLGKVKDASVHLLGIINDILDMSKIDANKLELSPGEFNFERMLSRVVDVINFRLEEKKQHLKLDLDNRVPEYLITDEQRLSQVITNLFSNAVKFTPEDGEITLTTRLEETEDDRVKVYVAITDTGIGISREQQEKLFQSFTQADAGISKRFGGTGLGLAISKSIVTKMDGEIGVESTEGEGSTFYFTFMAEKGEGKTGHERQIQDLDWKNLRVLAIDDDASIREYFQHIAQRFGFVCDVAASGEEACEILDSDPNYDVFFIDWKMPGMNGVELTRCIREKGIKNAIIIMISSIDWSTIETDAKAVGVDKFIPKPLFSSEIVDMIAKSIDLDEESKETADEEEMDDLSAFTILLVEDVMINQEIVIAMLKSTGVGITTANNGAEALQMMKEDPKRFDLIFMDIHMPEMDGVEATKRIRALDDEHAKNIPIIAMTANVFKDDIEKFLSIGMDDHVGKPLDFQLVKEKLIKYLYRSSK